MCFQKILIYGNIFEFLVPSFSSGCNLFGLLPEFINKYEILENINESVLEANCKTVQGVQQNTNFFLLLISGFPKVL